MTKEQIAPWIERLARANPKDRTAIVGELCKENGLKVGDAWRLLKEAGFDSKAAPQGNDRQGGAAPDNTGADSGSAGAAQPPGNTPDQPAPERKPEKKRVRHEHLKGKNLIVGDKTIAFDADGIAELDASDAERLMTIPGYTEVPGERHP
jgi:hypothetical protein